MPSNGEFSFRVLVGGQPIPEYRRDGDVFVETNLYTPASYKEKTEEVVGGHTEANAWPVTPYTVELTIQPGAPQARYTLTVDGFTVTKVTLSGGQSRIIRGFHDNKRGGISEFLFSLPRYSKEKNDWMKKTQVSDVGTIRVRSEDTWKNWLYKPEVTSRGHRCRTFAPATKKDSFTVTNGQYTMVTTRMGRNTPAPDRKSRPFRYYRWAVGCWRGTLEVKCRTDDAIRAMGFQIQPYPVCLTANNVGEVSTADNSLTANNNVGEVSTAGNSLTANNNVGEVCTAGNSRVAEELDTGSQQNQVSGNPVFLTANNNVGEVSTAGNSLTVNNNVGEVATAGNSRGAERPNTSSQQNQVSGNPVFLTANNVGEVSVAGNSRVAEIPDTDSQLNQVSGNPSHETGVGKAEEEKMSGMLEENPSSTPMGRDTTEEALQPDDSNAGDSHVKPRERSVEETLSSRDVEMADLHNTQVGTDNSKEARRSDDSRAGDPQTPLKPSAEEAPSRDVEMAALYTENSNKAAEAMTATACDSSREVKVENLVKMLEEGPERKPNLALLQPETIDLTVDNVPIIDLTIDDYLPDVYEVKVLPKKIEVVDLEEVEHKEQ